MYVIERWNGVYDEDYQDWIVAGFPTLKEATEWCYAQNPTRYRHMDHKIIPVERVFNIYRVEGESVAFIPWEDISDE